MSGSMLANPALADPHSLLLQIHDQVHSKMHGRIWEFRVVRLEGGLVLTGCTKSYYAKQLAQHLVMENTDLPILANDIQVQRP
jgi:hypothetical protein